MPLQQNALLRIVIGGLLLAAVAPRLCKAQSQGATFGDVIYLGGTPSDVVLDEGRQRLYLINSAGNRVDVFDYMAKKLLSSIKVGSTPLAGAMSMDGSTLYVSNNGSASLSVIRLSDNSVTQTVTLPAKPEGVEVGIDGRVLITTQGSGVGSSQNTLLFYDSTQQASAQVQPVQFPPPAPTPVGQPGVSVRPVAQFRGRLLRTPDGNFIVGLTVFNNGNSTYLFVYEAQSGTILNSRSVGGQSSVLSMSADGSKIMAGFTLYDVATLAVLGQMSTSNAPFPISGNFNTQQNFGGSAFDPRPDGNTLYAAFNSAPFSVPATSTQASTLFITDPANLAMRLAIKAPESIVARMVITSDGSEAWAMSESGLVHLPLAHLYDYPILQPDQTQVFMAQDPCNRGIAKSVVKINNLGKGKLTFSVPNPGAALIAQVTSGVAPADITLVMDPGRSGVTRQAGTNLYTGQASNSGTAVNINIASAQSINIPNTIRVYMNYRQDDQRGVVYPVPVSLDNNNGLLDVLLDETRNRLYVTNSGRNQIEVFDIKKLRFVDPILVGQLPRQMALGTDNTTMYVANSGSELISIVDLDAGKVVGSVPFPPIPRAGNAGVIVPRTLAYTSSGLMFVMTNGTQWKVIDNVALPRAADGVTPTAFGSPQQMLATPEADKVITLDGSGRAYLYDAINDVYTTARPLFSTPIMSYYGPLGASQGSNFFLANGLILNSSLTVIGGAERPGAVQTTAGTAPGQPATTSIVSAGQRNVATEAPIDAYQFVRLTTPVRNNITAVTRDDVRPTLELVDTRTGTETLIGVAPENPAFMVFGTARVNVSPRQMVVDSMGTTAYIITLSGLSVIPLAASGSTATRPALPNGVRSIVNSKDGSQNYRQGDFVTVNGLNLATAATADTMPVPNVLGGSCVLFNDVALPLLKTAPNQISAQIPSDVLPGQNVVTVRSLATSDESDPIVVNVLR